MAIGAPSAQKIIDAWNGVNDEWIVRRNKSADDSRQWEVVHRRQGTPISNETMAIVARFEDQHRAHAKAHDLEQLARAGSVQSMFITWQDLQKSPTET